MAKPSWLPEHIPSLDGLRGLAIVLVLMHHCAPRLAVLGLGAEAAWGWMGVNLFFVLSGFLITGILLDERGQPHFFRNFYVRRGLRIWPLYFLIMPLVYFTFAAGDNWIGARHGWLYFFLYIQNLVPGLTGALYPTWSLAIEEQFYLLWAPVVRLLRKPALAALLLFILAAGGEIRIHAFGSLTPVATLLHLDGLAAGCLVALLLRVWPSSRRRWLFAGWLLAAAGLAATLWANRTAPAWLNTTLAIGFAGVLLLAAAAPAVAGLSWHPLRYLGKISYGVYLVHMPIFVLLGGFDIYMDRLHPGPVADLLVIALRLAVTLAVASALWFSFERPILRLKRFFRPRHTSAISLPSTALTGSAD